MKSVIRWSTTLGLLGGTVLASGLTQTMQVLALPQEAIVKLFQSIPVFTIADEKGAPLVAVVENNKKVTGVFISQQDAQKFFDQLQKKDPTLASKVKVQAVSLGEVYKLADANSKKTDGLNFAYVPMKTEVDSAKKILGEKYQGGVPLFAAKAGPEQGYLTIQQNNDQVIPFFFEKAQLQEMVDRLKKEKPDLASSVKIEVIPLEGVIETLQDSNDEGLKKIRLVPSEETLKFIQTTIESQPKPNQTSPQNQPSSPKPKP